MTDATTFRLDTVDIGLECGWHVVSTTSMDEFNREGVAITVQYSSGDHIESIARQRPDRAEEFFSKHSAGNDDRLRTWLTGRGSVAAEPVAQPAKPPVHFTHRPDDWTRDEFTRAVKDANDLAFLQRLLELVDANSELPSQGMHVRLYFGKRPRGFVYVYPFGRRHPPFKFSVRDGRLMISGCWTGFPQVKGHPGFADLASMLGLDESGPATSVLIVGLDADAVWKVGENVSRAINS